MPFIKWEGGWAHINTGRRGNSPPPVCSWCGERNTEVLCDAKVNGRRCSKPLCRDCAEHRPGDKDYCPNHPPDELAQRTLF